MTTYTKSTTKSGETGDSYTILRVKRKRNEEPLDALVFDLHARKRTKDSKARVHASSDAVPSVSVFQFAETVETSAWKDNAARQELQDRITVLAQKPVETTRPAEAVGASDGQAAVGDVSSSTAIQSGARHRALSPATVRKYTIVENAEDAARDNSKTTRFANEPPKILAASSLAATKASFNLYDAVPSAPSREATSAQNVAPAPIDPEVERFLPLLQEYLKISEIDLSTAMPPPETARPAGPARRESDAEPDTETRIATEDEDDYVWDVYYYRPTLTQWNDLAHGGNVGSLTGLPPSINDPNDSDSESEPEDEDDEDSNAEDYYKNDYPDEESDYPSSDEFHDDSEYDDFLKDEMSEEEDHDWR